MLLMASALHIISVPLLCQLLTYGRRIPIPELFARIDAVDASTVKRVANRFIFDQVLFCQPTVFHHVEFPAFKCKLANHLWFMLCWSAKRPDYLLIIPSILSFLFRWTLFMRSRCYHNIISWCCYSSDLSAWFHFVLMLTTNQLEI